MAYKKIINATGNILSAPSRGISRARGRSADSKRRVIKQARASRGAPSFDRSGRPTQALKLRTAAATIKSKRKKR